MHDLSNDMKYVLKGLNKLFRVNVKMEGCLKHLRDDIYYCYNEMDHMQYAISVTKQNNGNHDVVEYEKKWKVDCRYCCNTPWV